MKIDINKLATIHNLILNEKNILIFMIENIDTVKKLGVKKIANANLNYITPYK